MDLSGVTNYAWITAAIATAGMMWGHVNTMFNRFRSFFVVSCTLEGDAAAGFFLYCRTHLKSSRFDKRHYASSTMHVKSLKKYRQIGMEEFGEFLTFFDGWKPLFANYKRADSGNTTMTISCARSMFDIEKILVEGLAMMDALNTDQRTSRYAINRHFGSSGLKNDDHTLEGMESAPEPPTKAIRNGYRILGWDIKDLGLDCEKKPFDALFYEPKVLEFIAVAKHWLDSKDFYLSHKIAWRLGAAFHGPPGTGKTSLARAIAQYLDLPVEIFDLPSMSNEELTRKWGRLLNKTPCIVLFEDLDRIFDEEGQIIKSGVTTKPMVTLDCLLNCMSGIETANGIFVIVTANDIKKLDVALGIPDENEKSSRPGRLDYCFHLGYLSEGCRTQLASQLLSTHPDLIPQVVAAGKGETGAQFQKRCGDLALNRYWQEFEKTKAAVATAPETVHKSPNIASGFIRLNRVVERDPRLSDD